MISLSQFCRLVICTLALLVSLAVVPESRAAGLVKVPQLLEALRLRPDAMIMVVTNTAATNSSFIYASNLLHSLTNFEGWVGGGGSGGGGSGETNYMADAGTTNGFRFSLNYDKIGNTNRLRTISGGHGILGTNEGTNLTIAVDFSVVASDARMDSVEAATSLIAAKQTNQLFLNGASNIVVAISNAPNNSVIYLSADTWNVTPSKVLSNGLGAINLFNKSNIVIQGIPGLSIINGRAAVGELLYITNCENVVIRDVTFDGLVVTNYTLLSGIGHVWGSIGVYNVRGLRFEGNSVINAHDHGIYDLGSQPNWDKISTNRVEILRNWFHNVGSQRTNEATAYDGTAIVPNGWTMDGNTFTECLRCIEPYSENDAVPNLEYRDIIRNNVAFNTLEFFLGSAGATNSHFLTVENNTMINDWGFTRRGTNIFDSSAAIAWNGGDGWKIKNNSIKGRWGYGIIASSGVRDGLIAYNHIYDLTNGGSAVPIQAGVTYRTDIIGNDIRRSENQAIYLFGYRDGRVEGNTIVDTAAGLGIRLLTSGGTVTSNVTLRANHIKVATVGIQDLAGGLENIAAVDNVIDEASTKYSNSSGAEFTKFERDGTTDSFATLGNLNTLSNSLSSVGGTNNPVTLSAGVLTVISSQTARYYTNAGGSFPFSFSGTPNASTRISYAVSNTTASAIYITNSSGLYDPRDAAFVTTLAIPAQSQSTFHFRRNATSGWELEGVIEKPLGFAAGVNTTLSTNSGNVSVVGAFSFSTNGSSWISATQLVARSGIVISNDTTGTVSFHVAASGGTSGPTTNAPTQALAINGGTGSTNVVIDFRALGATNSVRFTLTANAGIVVTNVIDGKELTVEVVQDSTGNRTIAQSSVGGAPLRFGADVTGFALSTNGTYLDKLRLHGSGTNAQVVGMLRGYTP